MTADGHSEALEVGALEKNATWTVGSIGYLVSTTWWNTWVQYSSYNGPGAAAIPSLLPLPGGSGPRPSPISNSELLPPGYSAAKPQLPGTAAPQPQSSQLGSDAETVPLRPGLVEQRDFVVVSAATWQRLYSWYGGAGPAIARRVVAEAAPGPTGRRGAGERWFRLALYPLRLEVVYRPKDGKERSAVVAMDPEAPLAALKTRACAAIGVADSEVILWDFTGRRAVRPLEPPAPLSTDAGATIAGTTSPMAVEDGAPEAPAAAAAGDAAGRTGDGGGGGDGRGNMDVDVELGGGGGGAAAAAAATAGKAAAVQGPSLREVPLLDGQLLVLRRTDVMAGRALLEGDEEDGEDDACGSDNDNDTGPAAGRKTVKDKKPMATAAATRVAPTEAAGAAALRRASAAGSSRSDGVSGPAVPAQPAITARTSGGGGGVLGLGSTRPAIQRSTWGALEDNVITRDGQPPGLAGLTNLGNTCFMSSSLQCLAHAVPLMRAFLGGGYLQDLNRSNPLGMKGELAEAFGGLMEQLWRGGLSAVTPRSFKAKIGRFAPQFSGYAQHDSQEFLAFLLDGLHEDTNRIKNKPYIEEKDLHGRPDEAVAAEAWSNYRARNDSLVVDHFQGLFKSTVDCPQCGFNSVKFDPFMYLSLPLPESRRRVVEVVLVHTDGSELPSRMALELASGATLGDLLRATASTAGLPAEVVTSPDSHLLAARTLRGTSATATYDELVLLTDCRVRVADAVDAGGAGGVSTYSLRSTTNSADAGLVVYYYSDAGRGPRAEGMAPVVVHFKRHDNGSRLWMREAWCGAPLVLYMPEAQPPYDPDQVMKVTRTNKTDKQEWVISGDCPLSSALVEVLRPIQSLSPDASAFPAAGNGASRAAEVQAASGPSAEAASAMIAVPPPPPLVAAETDAVAVAGRSSGAGELQAVAAAVPMEEDGRPVAVTGADDPSSDEALRPGTPVWDGDRGAAAAATAGGSGSSGGGLEAPLRRCSSGSGGKSAAADGAEFMEGMEFVFPLASAANAVPVRSASGLAGGGAAYGDSSMPGTPQPVAWVGMEDDVAAAPLALPPVILAGPPPSADAATTGCLGPRDVEPFNMWDVGSYGGNLRKEPPAVVEPPAAEPSGAAPGRPFSLKLCNPKGDPTLWDLYDDKEINVEHHREFLLFFNDPPTATTTATGTCATPEAARSGGRVLYDPELLDSPSEHPSLRDQRRRAAAGPQPVSLDACMTTFLQPERLAESDAWYCPRCKSHVCADKKLDLWSLPEVLVVHLKRFSYTRYSRNKLDTPVDFPLHGLDLGPYVLRPQSVPPVYDLFAVSNHYGSMGGGHYTAYAKLPSPPQDAQTQEAATHSGDRWYCFDDSRVSSVDPEGVRSPAAYVLFYRRRAEASADPRELGDLLEQLRQQRTELQQQAAAAAAASDAGPAAGAAAAAPGEGEGEGEGEGGSPGSGSDRQPQHDQDQDQDQGSSRAAVAASARRGGGLGTGAAAAQAACGVSGGGDGGDAEVVEVEVEGRSTAPFSLGAPVLRDSRGDGGDGARVGSSDLYGGVDGAPMVGPPSPTPMHVGNTYGGGGEGTTLAGRPSNLYDEPQAYGGYGYDAGDYAAFALDDGGAGCNSFGQHHQDYHQLRRGDAALLQPPGSPAEPDLDFNNGDLAGLYQEVDAMDVVRDRLSGSDAGSAGGNDLDLDADEEIDAFREIGFGGLQGMRSGKGGGPRGGGLTLMATSPPH